MDGIDLKRLSLLRVCSRATHIPLLVSCVLLASEARRRVLLRWCLARNRQAVVVVGRVEVVVDVRVALEALLLTQFLVHRLGGPLLLRKRQLLVPRLEAATFVT